MVPTGSMETGLLPALPDPLGIDRACSQLVHNGDISVLCSAGYSAPYFFHCIGIPQNSKAAPPQF